MGEAIKYLYSQFILRDVLSFITPGAIVLLSAMCVFNESFQSLSIHWLFYIPLFGLAFVIGFAIQCLGEFIGFIHFSPPDEYKWNFKKRWNILKPRKWTSNKSKLWWVDYYKNTACLWKADESEQLDRERMVVLKQMCGNNFTAFLLGGILISVSFCSWEWVRILIISIVGFFIFISLLWGHRVHVLRQYAREMQVLEQLDKGVKKLN